MRKKILALATLSLVACLGTGMSFLNKKQAIAEELTPTLDIVGHTLSLENDVHIKYAVSAENLVEGDTLKLQINQTEILTSSETTTNEGEMYYVFEYTGLSAKQMTDWVYAQAFVERGEEVYESETDKYSILEYAYNKLGKTEAEPTEDEELKSLLNAMLSYGAASQIYFEYKTGTLATDNFSYVRIDNATFEDGFSYGIFKAGEQVRVYPNEGYCLSDNYAEYLSEQNGEIWLTVPAEKTIDTTSLAENKKYSEGLEYTLRSNDAYEVSGIGTCTDTDIIIPKTYNGKAVTTIGEGAFYNCTSLTSVEIGDSVSMIRGYAFEDCTSLTSIVIPDSVNSIDYYAFANCDSLTSVYITDLAVWCNISFSSLDSNPLYYADNLYLNNQLVTELIIPDTVTKIKAYAFNNCTSFASIEIPDSVNSIGDYAFYECTSLTSVYITDIEAWCNISFGNPPSNPLYNAKDLYLNNKLVTELVIPDTVTEIKKYAFYNSTSMTSIEIPNSVNSIGDYVFFNCMSLTRIEISDSVTSIGASAFSDCTSLTIVYYKGGVEDWNEITISGNNGELGMATRYYYSETEPTVDGNYWHYDENGLPVVW